MLAGKAQNEAPQLNFNILAPGSPYSCPAAVSAANGKISMSVILFDCSPISRECFSKCAHGVQGYSAVAGISGQVQVNTDLVSKACDEHLRLRCSFSRIAQLYYSSPSEADQPSLAAPLAVGGGKCCSFGSNAKRVMSDSEQKKSKDVQHGPIHYPLWFGGSASCWAACVTHPLDLCKSSAA